MTNIGPKNTQGPPATGDFLAVVDLLTFNQIFVELVARQERKYLDITRADRRYTVDYAIQLGQTNDITGEFIVQKNGWAQNISISGIFFFVESPFERNTIMAMDLSPLGIPGHFVRIRILRSVQVLAHTYQIGAYFLHN